MTKADSVHSTPPTNTPTTRRSFLSRTAGGAASGAMLALATIPPASALNVQAALAASPDPVFALIAAHKRIMEKVVTIEAELTQELALGTPQSDDYNPIAEPASVDMDLFLELIETVPRGRLGDLSRSSQQKRPLEIRGQLRNTIDRHLGNGLQPHGGSVILKAVRAPRTA